MSSPSSPPGSPLSQPLPWNLVAPGYASESFAHFARYAADALALADVQSHERIVDVAAGPGSLTVQAAARVREVCALDFSSEMLKELATRTKGLGNVSAREGDGQALPYDAASFDAAFSMFGLMFFPDRARGFAELARVLRPGGRAVVASWQPFGDLPVMTTLFGALATELPHLPFGDGKGPLSDRDDFAREMSAAGFAVTIHERVHSLESPDIDSFWASVRKSLAPLVLLEHRMGAQAFAKVAAGIERRLRERHAGPQRVRMAAWLALGLRPS